MDSKTFLLALAMVTLMGTSVVIEKISLRGGSPLAILPVRSCLMTLCFLLAAVATRTSHELYHLSVKTYLCIAIPVLMGVVFLWLYYSILQKDLASRVFPIASVAPVITLVLSIFVLGEPFSWRRLIGILLAVSGIILIR